MYDRLCSWDNLLRAYRRAAKGKRGRANVAAFEHRLEDELVRLRAELLRETYRPRGYTSFWIHEPKRRLISAAAFRDRVVHHGLCNLIEPIFERSFVTGSYANHRGKGTHWALDGVQRLCRRYRFVLQCDVRQFFPSLDHDLLRRALRRHVADPKVLRLVDLILDGGEAWRATTCSRRFGPRGLPIGNLTSQFWANAYLNSFDHFVTRELRCRGYVRYVDDILLVRR